jgi:diaminopimelate epimerase
MFPKNFFVKSHGLGNEYIILIDKNFSFPLSKKNIETICNIHFGIGSDGILLLQPSTKADFMLRIYNPDGSEAEKSGNGIRIFCKFLYDNKLVQKKEFSVETIGGIAYATVNEEINGKARLLTIDIGKATFVSKEIPLHCEKTECIDFPIKVEDKNFLINCVSVGNPHCQVLVDHLDEKEIKKYGPLLENHPMFPNRINVQFVKVLSRNEVQILIYERGAGYTLASGSSSSAVAAMMVKKGLCDRNVTVNMPGGVLKLEVKEDWNIRLCGEVKQVAEGTLSEEFCNELNS